jgi:hypothetical protein
MTVDTLEPSDRASPGPWQYANMFRSKKLRLIAELCQFVAKLTTHLTVTQRSWLISGEIEASREKIKAKSGALYSTRVNRPDTLILSSS